jgi:hypothetical protein
MGIFNRQIPDWYKEYARFNISEDTGVKEDIFNDVHKLDKEILCSNYTERANTTKHKLQ